MNDKYLISKDVIMATVPLALRQDPVAVTLTNTLAEVLENRLSEIEKIKIYSKIDELPEELLDILARDFKVDWWDADYSIEEKRATLKDSWRVHRMLGTPAAVIMAISAIYPETKISEWWEYDGEPYHFRLLIDATFERVNPEKHARVLERVEFYKNLRSILDGVEYFDAGGEANEYAHAVCLGEEIIDGATAVRY